MKIEITKKGVHDKDGAEIEVGKTVDLGKDVEVLPGAFVGKCRVIGEAKDKEAVTAKKEK